jgi:hypothetical protein
MPAEIYSRTGNDVAEEIKRQFGDSDGRQITDADILKWINVAQQEIVTQNAILKSSLLSNVVANQAIYTYPSDRIQYIEAIHYDGIPLEALSFQEAQLYIMGDKANQSTTGTPRLWYERDGKITLYPKPDVALTDGLTLYFVKRPVDLTNLNWVLSVPDRYFQRVVDLVLTRAYQLDENWEAAQYKQTEYVAAMNSMANQENTIQVNSYPTPTVRPEDM